MRSDKHLRIAIDGESASGKSYASKIIGKKYKCYVKYIVYLLNSSQNIETLIKDPNFRKSVLEPSVSFNRCLSESDDINSHLFTIIIIIIIIINPKTE